MTPIACVHGLNNARSAVIAPRWESFLDIDGAKCFDVKWYSSASFAGDVVEFSADVVRGIFGSEKFRDRAQAEVSARLRHLVEADPRTIVLAHSMGTVLALAALRELAADGVPPPRCVFFGCPLGHPLHWPWLRSLGFDVVPPVRVLNFWNHDDAIVALPGLDPVFPHWLDSTRISIADNAVPRGVWEHDAELYLTHPIVRQALAELCEPAA